MSKSTRVAVVMAGGSGERFWPVSKPATPKQLLCLSHPTKSMLEEAIERISPIVGYDNVYVSTSVSLSEPIARSKAVKRGNILTEPTKRNTLGALVWVAAELEASGHGNATVAIVTADHKIGLPDRFRNTIKQALSVAELEKSLVTIGVNPTRPEAGFGYIQVNDTQSLITESGGNYYAIDRFREKPSQATAEQFLNDPRFYWNSGMFFFTLSAFNEALKHCQPDVWQILRELVGHLKSHRFAAASERFEEIPNISFDYAVMEHAPRVHMVPASFPWDDVGSWDSLDRSLPKDKAGNVSQGPSTLIDSHDCIVVNHDAAKRVGVLGLKDMIVVLTGEALLVCSKSHAQRVKEISSAMLPS